MLASEVQAAQTETQPQNLQILPASKERTLARVNTSVAERVEIRVETIAPEGTLVIEANADTVLASEATLISTPIQNQMQASQYVPATLTIGNAISLLTVGPKFDKIGSKAGSESTKSLTAHIDNLPS